MAGCVLSSPEGGQLTILTRSPSLNPNLPKGGKAVNLLQQLQYESILSTLNLVLHVVTRPQYEYLLLYHVSSVCHLAQLWKIDSASINARCLGFTQTTHVGQQRNWR